jgi:hypothetical protein
MLVVKSDTPNHAERSGYLSTSGACSSDDDAVLIVDETGDLKKGVRTVGCSGSTPAPPAGSRMPKGNHAPSHALV